MHEEEQGRERGVLIILIFLTGNDAGFVNVLMSFIRLFSVAVLDLCFAGRRD